MDGDLGQMALAHSSILLIILAMPMSQMFAGILPLWIAMGGVLAILVAFSETALLLPNTMIG